MLSQESRGQLEHRRKRTSGTALGLSLAALVGCASTQAAPQQPASAATASRAEAGSHEHGQQSEMMGMCPMRVPGTTVTVSDVAGGVAIELKTTGDVAELRRRVRHMAERHHGHDAQGMKMGMSHEGMVPSSATVEDVEAGARIVLTPNDPAQLGALRTHVHGHAERMARGECPMMMMGKDGEHSEHKH